MNLSRLAIQHRLAIYVQQTNGNTRQRQAHAAWTALSEIRITEVHDVLAHAIALENRVAELHSKLFEHLRGKRRRPGHKQSHEAADLTRLRLGNIEHADVHRGNAIEQRRSKILEFGGGLLVFESFEQAHAESTGEPAVEPIRKPVHVKQRQREQQPVRARDLPAREQIHRVHSEVVVREHRALGRARGSGCIDDAGRSVAVQRHWGPVGGKRARLVRQRACVPYWNRTLEVGIRDHGHRIGVTQNMGDLAIAIENVDRDENHSELYARDVNVDHLDAIGEIDAQAVALLETALEKELREPIAASVDLAESVGLTLKLEADGIAPADERKIK